MLTIRQLRIFAEVARCGKMSEAAGNLFISQPTVSQTIAELENELGVRLFDRFPKEVYLTEEGRRMLPMAQEILASAERLGETMREGSPVKTIRLGATVAVVTGTFFRLLEDFEREKPGVRVDLLCDRSAVIEEKLLDNALDLALIEGRCISQDIVLEPIINDYLALVCSAMHPLARRDGITLEEALAFPFIMQTRGSNTRDIFENYVFSHGLKLEIRWESSDVGAVKELLAANFGLSVLPLRLVSREVSEGSLSVLRVHNCIWRRMFHLAYHKNKHLTPEMLDLIRRAKTLRDGGVLSLLPERTEFNMLY